MDTRDQSFVTPSIPSTVISVLKNCAFRFDSSRGIHVPMLPSLYFLLNVDKGDNNIHKARMSTPVGVITVPYTSTDTKYFVIEEASMKDIDAKEVLDICIQYTARIGHLEDRMEKLEKLVLSQNRP